MFYASTLSLLSKLDFSTSVWYIIIIPYFLVICQSLENSSDLLGFLFFVLFKSKYFEFAL